MGKLTHFRAECPKKYDCTEKCVEQELYKIKFPTKNLVDACFVSPSGVELGASKICSFLPDYVVEEW